MTSGLVRPAVQPSQGHAVLFLCGVREGVLRRGSTTFRASSAHAGDATRVTRHSAQQFRWKLGAEAPALCGSRHGSAGIVLATEGTVRRIEGCGHERSKANGSTEGT